MAFREDLERVLEYTMFLNVLRLVMEKLDDLTAMKTTQDYIWYCQEGIHNRILE